MYVSRRSLIAGIAATHTLTAVTQAEDIEAAAARAKAALKDAKGTKLVLLGTDGGPIPGRRKTSSLMLHNGAAYVLDCGLGVTNE